MFETIRSRTTGTSSQNPSIGKAARSLQRKSKLVKKLAHRFANPVGLAFASNGLDISNDKHWSKLLILMAFTVYGGKGRGQPKQWSNKKLRRLRADVAQIKAAQPALNEEKCCEYLIKTKGGRYSGKKKSTLRRKLQDAKTLEENDQLIAASGDESVISAVTKDLKTHI